MGKPRTPESIIDTFRSAVDNETMRSTFIERLDELDVDEVREQISRMEAYADAIEAAKDAVEGWSQEEDREDRASAREDALQQLDELVDAWDAMQGVEPEPEEPVQSHESRHAENLAWIAQASLTELDLVGESVDDDPELQAAFAARRKELDPCKNRTEIGECGCPASELEDAHDA